MSPDIKTFGTEEERIIEEKERVRWEIYDLLGATLARLEDRPFRERSHEDETKERGVRSELEGCLTGLCELVREGGVEIEDSDEGGNVLHLRFYADPGLSFSSIYGFGERGRRYLVFPNVPGREEWEFKIKESAMESCLIAGGNVDILIFEVAERTGGERKRAHDPYFLPPVGARV